MLQGGRRWIGDTGCECCQGIQKISLLFGKTHDVKPTRRGSENRGRQRDRESSHLAQRTSS